MKGLTASVARSGGRVAKSELGGEQVITCDHVWSDPSLSAPPCQCVKCGASKARVIFPLATSLQGFAQWADDIAHGRLRNVDPAPKFWMAVASDMREAAAIIAASGDAAERIRSYIGNLTGEADDPFYQAVLALWGAGFDYAHGLRACGHSIGDWRDRNYDPEKPDQPLECRCVGCEREALLRGRIQAALDACEGDFLRCEQCDHQQDGAIKATDLFILVKAALADDPAPAHPHPPQSPDDKARDDHNPKADGEQD